MVVFQLSKWHTTLHWGVWSSYASASVFKIAFSFKGKFCQYAFISYYDPSSQLLECAYVMFGISLVTWG